MKSNRLSHMFTQLSDRERKLVVAGGTLVLVSAVTIVGVVISRKVSAMEEQVSDNAAALSEVLEQAPAYLQRRREDKSIDEQLKQAAGVNLQSALLSIAKEIKFEKRYGADATSEVTLDQFIKFSNRSEILADLTKNTKGRRKRRGKSKRKAKQQLFLVTIEVSFNRVTDAALFQFLERVETHKQPMFGVSLDISRESPNRDHFRAKLKVGQFRYNERDDS